MDSDLGFGIWDLGLRFQISNFKFQISNLRHQSSNLPPIKLHPIPILDIDPLFRLGVVEMRDGFGDG